MPGLGDLVVCPNCGADLSCKGIAFRCRSCERDYPPMGRLACLLPLRDRGLELWRAQLSALHDQTAASVRTFAAELRKPGLLAQTRARLSEEARFAQQIASEVDGILRGAVGPRVPHEPAAKGPWSLESLNVLHRDWGWPESEENARALACVERVLCAPLGRTLVLGAGGCRLAYDLHGQQAATLTLAVDVDLLVFTVADRVLRGERVPLGEVSASAAELDRLHGHQTLAMPKGTKKAPENLHLLLANGLAPPLRAHNFDTVVTPWFIDQIPPDLRDFVGVLRRLLVPGGRWLNYGPLLYPSGQVGAYRYTRQEVLELARRAGFEIEKATSERKPFLFSPSSGRGRIEESIAFSARVQDPPADTEGDVPGWIVLPFLPVSDFPGRGLAHHPNEAVRAVLGLVDGRRSIDDIAAAIPSLGATNPVVVKDTIRYCLLEGHPACQGMGPEGAPSG